jgi:hypothetical protein
LDVEGLVGVEVGEKGMVEEDVEMDLVGGEVDGDEIRIEGQRNMDRDG